jgi:hypothetical protein
LATSQITSGFWNSISYFILGFCNKGKYYDYFSLNAKRSNGQINTSSYSIKRK